MGQYVSRFWQPITNLANIYNSFVNNMAYLERIFETMDEPVVIDDKPNAETLPPITGAVDYNNITFGYEEGQTVLKDVDLHVKAGESLRLSARPARASPPSSTCSAASTTCAAVPSR